MTIQIPKSLIIYNEELGRRKREVERQRIEEERTRLEEIAKEEKRKSKNNFNISSDLTFVKDEKMYKEIVKFLDKTFPNNKSDLSAKLSFADGVMKGSNSAIPVGVDMFLKSINSEYRIAMQPELETDLQKFKGCYVDTGMALRNLTNTNKDRANYLFEQLKARGIKESNFPLWIVLRGLELTDGLNFNLTDESLYKTENCLNWPSGTKYSQTDNFCLPSRKDENSSRQIWTSKYALSEGYLSADSNLDSYYPYLLGSNHNGRVVLAKVRST